MRFTRHHAWIALFALASVLPWTPTIGVPIQNSATGETNGIPLDPASASVSLNRIGGVASEAIAEIVPTNVFADRTAEPFVYYVLPTIGPGDSGIERVEIDVPVGFANASVTGVQISGAPLTSACPATLAGQYCASNGAGTMTVGFGRNVDATLASIRIEFTADTPATAGSADFPSRVADGAITLETLEGDANADPGDANSIKVEIVRSQGIQLELVKSASRADAVVGDVVTYSLSLANTADFDVLDVTVEDRIPPDFKYVSGSARLDGAPTPEPTGNRLLEFDIGTIPAPLDLDGNGALDAGEPGYLILTYQLVVGSGATPGAYDNTAVARDYCETCFVSNEDSARVEVTLDPDFDLGTIIGKVYEDRNQNGTQDPGETGVPNAMVALDDGSYALTDPHGRYHFPAVVPGHRMLKINLASLPPGTIAATTPSSVVWATPGIMVRVNFGVVLRQETETIGRPPTPAVKVAGVEKPVPVEVVGSAETLSVLVNGARVPFPSGDVRLRVEALDENVSMSGGVLEPVRFDLDADPAPAEAWRLTIRDSTGSIVRSLEGVDTLPDEVVWDGRDLEGRAIAAGEIYQYQLDVAYADGSRSSSSRRLFGVDRTSVISLNLQGDAFESGEAILSPKAKEVLEKAAEILRRFPDEKVVIEGHTDSIGSWESNVDLSRGRAEAAAAFLVDDQGLPRDQFVTLWYGEDRPVAPNELAEGRTLNRRVEIRGEMVETESVRSARRFHATPEARIGGAVTAVGPEGRFAAAAEPDERGELEIRLGDSTGRAVETSIAIPDLAIESPSGELLLGHGASARGCDSVAGSVTCRLAGHTEPGNLVELDGRPLAVEPDGSFDTALTLAPGENIFGVIARNPEGFSRIVNLLVSVTDHDAAGHRLEVADGVPDLTLDLPPQGVRLRSPQLPLTGQTDPENEVLANGKPLSVGPDGRVAGIVELPRGTSRLVVEVRDPDGRRGAIEREVEVAKNELFFMAFADGKFGKLKGSGYIEGAGLDEAEEYYTEGRVAFYLKGVIAGKYLISSAFDSGQGELDTLFDDLDGEGSRQLLTNLDPDRFYPVYGDSSTVIFDAESQGKLYLALDSETIQAVIGNYPLSLTDTELATYRRTLYGGRFAYRSVARTRYGEPDTQVVVFGAQVRQVHTSDQLRATGGSLFYLSHSDVIEGSEQVTLIVRDKNTGLMLQQQRQRQNVDYTIKYPEGRIMFHRPIASVVQGGTLVDRSTLSGNPVYVYVDYERIADGFEKTATGGRVRQQIGDHVAVGGTYVQDELEGGQYELQGLDAEVRLGHGTRLIAEVAGSSGTGETVFVSQDGGLSYDEVAEDAAREGTAWKAAAELDVGEWFGRPDRHRVSLYFKELDPGFSSSDNQAEQGTRKYGLNIDLMLTRSDQLLVRHSVEQRSSGPTLIGDSERTTHTFQWRRQKTRWGVAVEYFSVDTTGEGEAFEKGSTLAAARYWVQANEKTTAMIEHQQSLSGATNDQTTLGVEYQALPSLGLSLKGTTGTLGQSAQAGVIYTREKGEIYLTRRLVNEFGGRTTSTVLGARSPLGPSTKIYTEYQREDSIEGSRVMRLLGLQRQWDVNPGLRFLFAGELAEQDATASSDSRSAVSAGLSYSRPAGLQLFTRQEVRLQSGDQDRIQFFTVNQLDYPVGTDFTVLARYRYSRSLDRELDVVDASLDERVLGMAFRPVAYDRFNSLFKYTRLADQRPPPPNSSMRSERTMDVLSLDTALQVHRRLEWLAKGTLKLQEEQVDDLVPVETSTYLLVQRLNFGLWSQLNLGLEYRVLAQRQAADQRAGWLSEVTWELIRNFRVGGGYNFTDFSDDEFSDNDYSVEGWFFRVQGRY